MYRCCTEEIQLEFNVDIVNNVTQNHKIMNTINDKTLTYNIKTMNLT